ncbi:MAG: hypothetical protein ACK4GO_01780 [Gemmobacter sp.]
MLHILANALMIATRLDTPQRPRSPESLRRQDEENRRRAWSLIGGIRF